MNYIDEIFQRANLQKIREFLQYGTECATISKKSYEQRIKEAHEPVERAMVNNISDVARREEIMNEIYHYTGEAEQVYMEVGMRCGALIATQLFCGNTKA